MEKPLDNVKGSSLGPFSDARFEAGKQLFDPARAGDGEVDHVSKNIDQRPTFAGTNCPSEERK